MCCKLITLRVKVLNEFVLFNGRLQLLGFDVGCGDVRGRRSQEKVSRLYFAGDFSHLLVSFLQHRPAVVY